MMSCVISEIEHLCRLCAVAVEFAQDENHDLFQTNNVFVHQQIKELAGLVIENDPHLPRHFCVGCKNALSQAYEFRSQLIEVHKYFEVNFKNSLQNVELGNATSSFDTVFLADKLLELKTENKTIAVEFAQDDLCELESSYVLNNFESIENEFLNKDEQVEETVKKIKPKTKNKTFLKKYKQKNRKKKTEQVENLVPFICEQCGMSFRTMKFLEIHAVRHEEKKFECDICSSKFFLPTELKRHKFSHTGEKPIKCRYCETKFLNKSNRNRHEKSQHLKLRPYPCELCDKAFGTSHLKKNHMLVHTKERAFDCKLCQKSFLRKNHLMTHYKSTAHKKNEMDNEIELEIQNV